MAWRLVGRNSRARNSLTAGWRAVRRPPTANYTVTNAPWPRAPLSLSKFIKIKSVDHRGDNSSTAQVSLSDRSARPEFLQRRIRGIRVARKLGPALVRKMRDLCAREMHDVGLDNLRN